jgi:hypothetical protein
MLVDLYGSDMFLYDRLLNCTEMYAYEYDQGIGWHSVGVVLSQPKVIHDLKFEVTCDL